jgi:hypothetical protein
MTYQVEYCFDLRSRHKVETKGVGTTDGRGVLKKRMYKYSEACELCISTALQPNTIIND